jgi:cyclic pyranopterin phosphate synthase
VISRGDNDDELEELLAFARDVDAEIRFIEYMDVGGATAWRPEAVVSQAEILERLTGRFGSIAPLSDPGPRRPRRATGWPTASPSASSPRRRSPSAAPAIACG